MSATDINSSIGSRECTDKEGMTMSLASRMSVNDLPAATSFFVLLHRGVSRAVATIALWHRRTQERRQLAWMLDTSAPGFLHDTSILCTEAEAEAKKPFWRA
jgi:uncharacterized protein YjiS (DUF1127 family)